ncbi:MAG: hypothetical protein ACI9S8_000429 [Chlamydiales bacterium]|jgi:hypothetical protein
MRTINFFTPVIPHSTYSEIHPTKSKIIQFAENYFNLDGEEAHCMDSGEDRLHKIKLTTSSNNHSSCSAVKAFKIASYFTLVCPLVALTIKGAHRWNNSFYVPISTPLADRVPYKLFPQQCGAPRYNDLQMKAAHNSFDKGSLSSQLTFSKSNPWEGGCLAVELDLVQNPKKSSSKDTWEFVLQHGSTYSPTSRSLPDALKEINKWSEREGDHLPITIHLDLKETCFYGNDRNFAKKLDFVIEKVIPRRKIITPSEIKQNKQSLQESVQSTGWPKIEDIKGKFIFVITGADTDLKVANRRTAYLNESNKNNHLAFVDMDQRAITSLDQALLLEKNRIFLNVKLGSKNWKKLVTQAQKEKLVTRIWKANTPEQWDQCIDSVNIIATDKIFGSPWACL